MSKRLINPSYFSRVHPNGNLVVNPKQKVPAKKNSILIKGVFPTNFDPATPQL